MAEPVLLLREQAEFFIQKYMQRRINQNKNFLGIICGTTGSGKSYSAMRLGELFDPNFNIDRVVFKTEDFMKVVNDKKLKKGSVIIFDEAGVGLPAREWYSISNKLINYILQIFRYKNVIVLFTTPSLSFVDSQARNLFHAFFQTQAIDFRHKEVLLKPLFLQTDSFKGDIYKKYLRLYVNGKTHRLKRIRLGMPDKELIDAYEKKKTEFANWLSEGTEVRVKILREKEIIYEHKCFKCGYEWESKLERPLKCANPRCKSGTWNILKETASPSPSQNIVPISI